MAVVQISWIASALNCARCWVLRKCFKAFGGPAGASSPKGNEADPGANADTGFWPVRKRLLPSVRPKHMPLLLRSAFAAPQYASANGSATLIGQLKNGQGSMV